ncbi:PREDICTED: protein FAM110D-like [Priapulus caudatus]|uniref:Protein FAM110D-like n=1 Tax=Priapulus caudatus TaxID=37621 RepID=A0ABM1EIC9_PRICU|nr:PREDICTED: protein FAM110D-like [Priapulus caudatus]
MGSTDELDISEYSHRANASLHTSDSRPDASAQNSFEEVDASPPPVTAAPPAGRADDGQPSTIKRQPVGRAKSDLQCRSSSQQQQPRPHASEAPLPVHTDPPYHRSASQQLRLAPGGDHGVAASDARHHANAQQRGDAATQPAAHSGDDVERFFNEMGIERGVLRGVMEVASRSSVFFDSVSSVDSNNAQTGMRAGGGAPRGGAGLREGGGTPRGGAGLREGDLANFGRTETSIVEKNARIIKWLINCRKACSVVVK